MIHPDFWVVKLWNVRALESVNIWGIHRWIFKKIYRPNPNHIPNTFIYSCSFTANENRLNEDIYRGNKQKTCRVCTWIGAWWHQTHLAAIATLGRWSPTAAFQPSEEEERHLPEQELWLLISFISFDPITHFFQREALESSRMGWQGEWEVGTWWSDDPRLSKYEYGKDRSLRVSVIKSPTSGQGRQMSNITPCHPASMLRQV